MIAAVGSPEGLRYTAKILAGPEGLPYARPCSRI
jgi:hypothetical protein